MTKATSSDTTVWILLGCLVVLLALLFFLYKKLNKEANGEYTIRRMVFKEGGVRDRLRGVVASLETRLGVQLWPRSDSDEDGEEMQNIHDEEGKLASGGSDGSGSEEEDREEEEGDNEDRTGEGDDSSDDHSSTESCEEAGEMLRLVDEQAKEEVREEREDTVGDGGGLQEAGGGPGLLIDLKHFSGSATWSEGGVCQDGDITAL